MVFGSIGGSAVLPIPSNMKYLLAIFDLDGTLADSFPFFLSAQHRLADKYGFARIAADEVEAARRKPVSQLIRESGLPVWKLARVAADFRTMMRDADGIAPFPGVPDMLAALQQAGIVLALVTSNSRENARRVLGERDFSRFTHVDCGMSILGKRPRLRRLVRAAGVSPRQAIYIGDQDSDGDAARGEGLAFGAVGWGYAAPEILRAGGPDHEFATVADIGITLLGES
ncbi:HAD hydrolase-like protein [Arenimonas composti]|uniref:Haloacid dehalogenase n=2 Tax=Arenimonas TaxID=490567 RepID=A0A091C1J0_9GAMM|nr:HAD hydrolase-like protein [Arenimonas composti]KFN50475.1 hypothetical protein P873_07370 [Arenimonas composti TR7-09 = DSM 18010]